MCSRNSEWHAFEEIYYIKYCLFGTYFLLCYSTIRVGFLVRSVDWDILSSSSSLSFIPFRFADPRSKVSLHKVSSQESEKKFHSLESKNYCCQNKKSYKKKLAKLAKNSLLLGNQKILECHVSFVLNFLINIDFCFLLLVVSYYI